MKKLIVLSMILAFAGILGCATTTAKVTDVNSRVLTVATKINDITGALMRTTGPLAITGICLAQPEYCAPAKASYSLALAAQVEYKAVLADATAANAAPDGTKLATLASTFQAHFTEINKLIVAGGGHDNSATLTDLSANLAELQAVK